MIVCIALLLAAAVSVVLARGFLPPIRRLARGTHRLATGDYAQRITNDRTDEFGQLIDDFNGLAATLGQAESARREFLADVSHQLRTPLAILRGELEALEDGVRSLTPEAIKSLQVEVAALAGLIDDLRDLSDADVGNVSYERNDVGPLRAAARDALRVSRPVRRTSPERGHDSDFHAPRCRGGR